MGRFIIMYKPIGKNKDLLADKIHPDGEVRVEYPTMNQARAEIIKLTERGYVSVRGKKVSIDVCGDVLRTGRYIRLGGYRDRYGFVIRRGVWEWDACDYDDKGRKTYLLNRDGTLNGRI